MKSCTFLKGRHDLFMLMGIPYGILVIEDHDPVVVYCLEEGRLALRKAVEKEILTTDDASIVEAAMTKAGLVKNASAFFQKVRDFVLADDHNPVHTFKLCGGCTRNPLPHGAIIGDGMVKQFQDFWSGLKFCDEQVEEGNMNAFDSAAILKAMLAANLPQDEEDAQKRWGALPEETRKQYQRVRVIKVTIPGLGTGTFLDI